MLLRPLIVCFCVLLLPSITYGQNHKQDRDDAKVIRLLNAGKNQQARSALRDLTAGKWRQLDGMPAAQRRTAFFRILAFAEYWDTKQAEVYVRKYGALRAAATIYAALMDGTRGNRPTPLASLSRKDIRANFAIKYFQRLRELCARRLNKPLLDELDALTIKLVHDLSNDQRHRTTLVVAMRTYASFLDSYLAAKNRTTTEMEAVYANEYAAKKKLAFPDRLLGILQVRRALLLSLDERYDSDVLAQLQLELRRQAAAGTLLRQEEIQLYQIGIRKGTHNWSMAEAFLAYNQAKNTCQGWSPQDGRPEDGLRLSVSLEIDYARLLARIGDMDAARRALTQASMDLTAAQGGSGISLQLSTLLLLEQITLRVHDTDTAIPLLGRQQALVEASEQLQVSQKSALQHHIANSRGWLQLLAGDLTSAEKELTAAIESAPNKRSEAEARSNLGWVRLENGAALEASKEFEQALRIFQQGFGDHHFRTAECMCYAARAAYEAGNVDQARARILLALQLREDVLRTHTASIHSERERLAFLLNLRAHLESPDWPGVLDTYLYLAPKLGISPADQYQHVLFWKGVDTAAATNRQAGSANRAEYDRIYDRILALADSRLIRQDGPQAAKAAELQRQRRAELIQLENALVQAERNLTTNTTVLPMQQLTLADVQAGIGEDASLFDITTFRGAGGTEEDSVFLVSPTTVQRHTLTQPPGKAMMTEFRESIVEPLGPAEARGQRDAKVVRLGVEVGARFPLPPAGTKRLLIVADGKFQRCPFPALRTSQNQLWCERWTIHHFRNPHAVAVRRAPTQQSVEARQWLLVGGVEFGEVPAAKDDTAEHEDWGYLDNTRKEVNAIKELLSTEYLELSGEEASKSALLLSLPTTTHVHIATHGYERPATESSSFDTAGAAAGLDSGLVLAGFNSSSDRSKSLLTAAEVRRMRLPNLDLVVLSGCQTGLGHAKAGAGVVGLQDAFLRAGATDVISSLWEVPDATTRDLMQKFYQEYLKTDDPALALQKAQTAMSNLPAAGWAAWRVVSDARK